MLKRIWQVTSALDFIFQCKKGYSLRIALILNGVHERKIHFAIKLGMNSSLKNEIIWLFPCKLKCIEMFCWTEFSHRGAKCVRYQGVPIGKDLEYEVVAAKVSFIRCKKGKCYTASCWSFASKKLSWKWKVSTRKCFHVFWFDTTK